MQSFLKTQPKEMPTVLEAGTLNGHGIAGLHAALNYILNVGTEQIKRIECQRMRQFYEGIKHLDVVKIYGDFSNMERAPIVALNYRKLMTLLQSAMSFPRCTGFRRVLGHTAHP